MVRVLIQREMAGRDPSNHGGGRTLSNTRENIDERYLEDWSGIRDLLRESPVKKLRKIWNARKGLISDPLLHVLIEYEETDLALDVIDDIENDPMEDERDLFSTNMNTGDTALHVAARTGNIKVAGALVDKLKMTRNNDGEIPLHKAALAGNSELFWNLHNKYIHNIVGEDIVMSRTNNGATILHCAVMGNNFKLAEDIVEKYPDLMFHRDYLGMTVLHHMVISLKTFKESGSQLSLLQFVLYKCIIVKEKSHTRRAKYKAYYIIAHQIYGKIRNLGQWVRGLFTTRTISMRKRNHETTLSSDVMGDEEDPTHGHSAQGYSTALMDDGDDLAQHKPLVTLIISSLKRILVTFIRKQITRVKTFIRKQITRVITSIRKQITRVIMLSNSGRKLFALKKKDEERNKSGISLVYRLAKRRDYWRTLTYGGNPGNQHALFPKALQQDKMTQRWMESPLILAATLGSNDFVEKILKFYPATALCVDTLGKNLLHVAAENKLAEIVDMLPWIKEMDPRLPYRLTSAQDQNGNSILHLAAKCNSNKSSPMQMAAEFKWFEKIKEILPGELDNHRNNEGKTAKEVFTESHERMLEEAKKQLTDTARSCCGALVSAVTFAAGFSIANSDKKEKNGDPRTRTVLKIFSHAYMFGLSCTAMALLQFMALLMASYKEEDFRTSLPTQYVLAFTSLGTAIIAMVVAFGCNTYIGIYNDMNTDWKNYMWFCIEILIFPFICLLVMHLRGVKIQFISVIKRFLHI